MKGVTKVKKTLCQSGAWPEKYFFIKTTEFCFKSIKFFRNCKLIGAGRLHSAEKSFIMPPSFEGGLAQLGERLHGMQEVSGSIPLFSTKQFVLEPDSLWERVRVRFLFIGGFAFAAATNTPVGCLSNRTVCVSRWRSFAPTSSTEGLHGKQERAKAGYHRGGGLLPFAYLGNSPC